MSARKPIVAGAKFGRLTVIGPAEPRIELNGAKAYRVECACDCGEKTVVREHTLRNGETKSCGCLHRDVLRAQGYANRTHGRPDGYASWGQMINRCTNSNNHAYESYGGRGITVCDRWRNSFEAFYEDMGPRPGPKHSIDRIDNDGDYEPSNCRWATTTEQGRNTRRNRMITWDGRTQCLAAWAEEIGINKTALCMRLRKGWDVDSALTRPVATRSKRRP